MQTGGRWIVVAILIPAGLFLIATTSIAVTTGAAIEWRNVGASTEFPDWPRSVYWLANVVFFGFGEEVGWRGFALPRLQSHASALHASLVLAAGWAGWHLPLFAFGPGLSTLGLAGSVGWLMSLALGSILLTWLFNASVGSIGAVVTPRWTSSSAHPRRGGPERHGSTAHGWHASVDPNPSAQILNRKPRIPNP
jgi:CAAX protease family protein